MLIIIPILIATFAFFSILSVRSLNKLGFKVSSYYSFGRYLPGAGKWSVGIYVLILITLVGLLIFLSRFAPRLPDFPNHV